MASENSFDVVSTVDRQEVDNALNQAAKEVSQRYDFKGTDASIRWSGDELRTSSKSRDDLQTVQQMIKDADYDFAVQFTNYQ